VILRVVITSISLHFGVVDAKVKAKLSPDGAVCGICQRSADRHRAEVILFRRSGDSDAGCGKFGPGSA